jgi:hypothetical protein
LPGSARNFSSHKRPNQKLAGMEPSTFGVANKRVNIDTIGATIGATEKVKGERRQ